MWGESTIDIILLLQFLLQYYSFFIKYLNKHVYPAVQGQKVAKVENGILHEDTSWKFIMILHYEKILQG